MSPPPAVPPVADADRYVAYPVDGAPTTFADVPFPIYGDASDLEVLVDGVKQPAQNWSLLSKSGYPLASLPQPITDGQIFFEPAAVGMVIEVIGAIHPRQTIMPTMSGIGRREFNYIVGYIVSTLRELRRRFNLGTSQPLGFDAAGPLSAKPSYDFQPYGFRFAQTDDASGRPILFVKLSDDVADWSQALVFQGANGAQGPAGPGSVDSVATGFGLSGGPITATGTIALDPTQFGFGARNRLMNGGMAIDQRYYGNSVTLGSMSGVSNYCVDRWAAYLSAAASGISAQRISVKSGGVNYALRLQRAASSSTTSTVNLAQVLETDANIDLQGRAVTLSFKARRGADFSGSGQQITAALVYGTGADQGSAAFAAGSWSGQANVATSSPVVTTDFQTFVVQGTVPAGATQLGVKLSWTPTGTAGADDWLDITDVELALGTLSAAQAASPERRPLAVELALCQRFYTQSWELGGGVTTNGDRGAAYTVSQASTPVPFQVEFTVRMRSAPTVTVYSPSGDALGDLCGRAGPRRRRRGAVERRAAAHRL